MIYITGDKHVPHDAEDLNTTKFPEQKKLTKKDFVIITGDIGIVWSGDNTDKWWQKWFEQKNFTTLFVDGNHEDHDSLDAYPIKKWNGGNVHFISKSVIHLMRGQVFEIDGNKIFTFGGASSWDRARVNGKGWWAREEPSEAEYDEAMKNLEKHKNKVDYIITHTCSNGLANKMVDNKGASKINSFFTMLDSHVKFKKWYFGHYHRDISLDSTHRLLYHNILKLGE